MTYDDTFRRFVDVLAETLDEPASYPGRLHGSGYELAAPNGVHFHPPGGLRLRATER
jgi:hypothetical protein